MYVYTLLTFRIELNSHTRWNELIIQRNWVLNNWLILIVNLPGKYCMLCRVLHSHAVCTWYFWFDIFIICLFLYRTAARGLISCILFMSNMMLFALKFYHSSSSSSGSRSDAVLWAITSGIPTMDLDTDSDFYGSMDA